MKRFYLANASETPPRPPVSPSYGYPQDGNRSLNQKPTKLGAYWFHMITEEFMAVIEGAGLEPSETNLHQLADIFEDFRNRATASEEYKIAAEAAAKRAEAAAQGVVTETAEKIKEIQTAGTAQVERVQQEGSSIAADVEAALNQMRSKLQELIEELQAEGGRENSALQSAAQKLIDEINQLKPGILADINSYAVLTVDQTLDDAQKKIARANIGAAAESEALKKTEAQSTYLGITAKAASAAVADSATVATRADQDGNGATIATTYATVAAMNSGLAGKAQQITRMHTSPPLGELFGVT